MCSFPSWCWRGGGRGECRKGERFKKMRGNGREWYREMIKEVGEKRGEEGEGKVIVECDFVN